jgi:serine/threonine protein kinase
VQDDSLREVAEQRVGKIIKGKYRVDKVLGMGGMAVVYAVTHERNNAELALKMLHPELSIRGDIRQRFLREGYAGNSVKHAGVVMVVDDDTSEDGAAFIVMERLHGLGVDEIWAKYGQRLPVPMAVAIVDQLLDVLRAAHEKGIVHRDIKPANMFVTREGTVKVLDFGIARVRDALASSGAQMTGSGVLMGTPAYMSPEQALARSSDIDAQSDVWAVGATLYTLISGRFVHEAENGPQMLIKAATVPAQSIANVAAGVPQPIVDVIAKALAFDKATRYPSAAAMRDALREAHRVSFGPLRSRDTLESLFHEVGEAHTQLATSVPALAAFGQGPPAVGTEPRAGSGTLAVPAGAATPPPAMRPGSGGTTAQPVSNDPIPLKNQKSSRTPLFAAGGLAALLLVGGGIWLGKSQGSGTSAGGAPPPTASAVPAAPTAPAVIVTATPSVTMAVATPSTTPPPVQTLPPITSPPPSTKPGGKPSAKPSASAAPPTAAPKPNCEPPYFFDAQGKKQWKAECL